MSKKRIEWIDLARGIGILLMVIGFVFVIGLGVLSVVMGLRGSAVGQLFQDPIPWWLCLVLMWKRVMNASLSYVLVLTC